MNKFTFPNGAPGIGDTVVFAGDSITEGYQSSNDSKRWITLLCSYYGCTENNKGVSGKRIDNYDFTNIPSKSVSIKYLFIALGINDVFNANTDALEFYESYKTALEYCHNDKGYNYDDIILLTPYYVANQYYINNTNGTYLKHLQFKQKVHDISFLYGCHVADVYTWFSENSNPDSLLADYIHPNDSGYSVIADYFETASVTLVNSAIVRWADINSVTTISNGSWIQAIAESVGITEPTNGSYLQALAEYAGATEPVNGSWLIALCNALSITSPVNGSWMEALATSGTFVTTDPDSDAFITAAGITDPVQQAALDTLVVGLKAVSLWSKCSAIYPMVGGSATSHKFNLKNPLNTDDAFRLDFAGGWTHAITGATPNGTTGYAKTHFIPSINASYDSIHLSYYSRTDNTHGDIEIGSNAIASKQTYLLIRYSDGGRYRALNRAGYVGTGTITRTDGYMIGSRIDNLEEKYYFRGNNIATNSATNSDGDSSSAELYIGAFNNNGTANQFSNRECAFCTIGEGLNPTEAASLYTLVQAFNTTLGRQV